MSKTFTQLRAEWLEALQDAGVSPSAFSVAFAIGRCLNSTTGDAWPSQQWIAGKTGLSVRQIRDLIKDLRDEGFLIVSKGRYQKPNRYSLPKTLPSNRAAVGRRSDLGQSVADRRRAAGQSGAGPPPNSPNQPFEECSAPIDGTAWCGPGEIWRLVEEKRGTAFASSYLARSGWDADRREIGPWSSAAQLRLSEIQCELELLGVGIGAIRTARSAQRGGGE